jgi:hypothetical protein
MPYHLASWGRWFLFPARRKADFLSSSAGIQPANLGSSDKHVSHYTAEDDVHSYRVLVMAVNTIYCRSLYAL